jgi:hypothetical protein
MAQCFPKEVCELSQPAIPLLGIYTEGLKNMFTQKLGCMLRIALFIIAQKWG